MAKPRRPSPLSRRPRPPADLLESPLGFFRPALDLERWAASTFIGEGSPLCNPTHAHLIEGRVAFLWATVEYRRQGRQILGQAQILPPSGSPWSTGRSCQQIEEWFGGMPDFMITLDARACEGLDDPSFCALVEHELCHCGQARDPFGAPKFNKAGQPEYAMRGHDVEEFTEVVRRYGAAAAGGEVVRLVQAAAGKPEIAPAKIAIACGVCMRLAA